MLANTLLKTSYVDEQCPINLICYFSPFISCLSHLSSYLSLFICYLSHFIGYLTTSYLVYHCSYLDEHPFFNFISWWTCPKKLHILFINLQLFTNIPLKTSYVDEQCLKILICYFSCFSSYLSLTSYLDEHLPLKFIAYFTEFSCYLSLFIAYLSISYLDELICYLALFSSWQCQPFKF